MCKCIYACASVHVWRSKVRQQAGVPSVHHMDLQGWIWGIRVGSKCRHALGPLSSPWTVFNHCRGFQCLPHAIHSIRKGVLWAKLKRGELSLNPQTQKETWELSFNSRALGGKWTTAEPLPSTTQRMKVEPKMKKEQGQEWPHSSKLSENKTRLNYNLCGNHNILVNQKPYNIRQ